MNVLLAIEMDEIVTCFVLNVLGALALPLAHSGSLWLAKTYKQLLRRGMRSLTTGPLIERY